MTNVVSEGARARSRGQRRRSVVQGAVAGLGGLAASRFLPGLMPTARAATAFVTPDPIKERIQKGGLTVEIVEFCTIPASSTTGAKAYLNQLSHAGDGSGRLFVVDSRGKLWWVNRSTGVAKLALDLKKARGSAFVAPTNQQSMGFRSFAFHPDRGRAGRPGRNKIYTVSTETVASRPAGVPLLGGPYPVLFHDVIAEWSTYVTAPYLLNSSSRREVLRIAQYQKATIPARSPSIRTRRSAAKPTARCSWPSAMAVSTIRTPTSTTVPRPRGGRSGRSCGSIRSSRPTAPATVFQRKIRSSAEAVSYPRSMPW
ncbi:MAG: hypothetical protein ACJ8H8_06230, partial [Geminicoccaceae bacterium]